MKVLVCGGRDYRNTLGLWAVLDDLHYPGERISILIHGAARGADAIASNWARARGVKERPFPITAEDWAKYGRVAGPLRNRAMLDEGDPDMVVAFPGGAGTRDMVSQAARAGVPIQRVSPPTPG